MVKSHTDKCKNIFEDELGCTVFTENEVNVGALAEGFYKTCKEIISKRLKVVLKKYGHFKQDIIAVGLAAVVEKCLES